MQRVIVKEVENWLRLEHDEDVLMIERKDWMLVGLLWKVEEVRLDRLAARIDEMNGARNHHLDVVWKER